MILAEPDYLAPQQSSPKLKLLRTLQTKSLEKQGANPHIGSTLKTKLSKTNLQNIHVNILQNDQQTSPSKMEWQVIEYDIKPYISDEELQEFKLEYQQAIVKNHYPSVSTFYAIGYKS